MAKFPLDLSRFKKISSDAKTTTLAHPDGHSVIVAHRALSPKMRSQLASMEVAKMADSAKMQKYSDGTPEGGAKRDSRQETEDYFSGNQTEAPSTSTEISAPMKPTGLVNHNGAPLSERGYHAKEQNEAQGGRVKHYADGTGNVSNAQDSPDQIANDARASAPQQAPVVVNVNSGPPQPSMQERYNSAVMGFPNAKGGSPDADMAERQSFGQEGQMPAQFNPQAWQQSQDIVDKQQAMQQAQAQQRNAQAIQENQVRSQAGVPLLPTNPQAASNQVPTQDDQTSPRPQSQDIFGTGKSADMYEEGRQDTLAGMKEEAKATGDLGRKQANMLAVEGVKEEENFDKAKTNFDDALTEYHNFEYDVKSDHINPRRYVESMSTGAKIGTAIGLILSGMGAGLTGGPNLAMEALQKNIDADIDAQKANLGKKQSLLSANLQHTRNLKDAADMTRAMQSSLIAHRMDQEAARQADPIAQARLKMAAGEFKRKSSVEIMQVNTRRNLAKMMNDPNASISDIGPMLNQLRMVDPKTAEELQKRYVPGIGLAQIPLPDKERGEIIARTDLSKQMLHLEKWAEAHSGSLNPADMNTGSALARNVQDAYRRANSQGVFREAEKDFVEKSLSANPTAFFNKVRVLPGYKATLQSNNAALKNLYQSYGFKVPEIKEAPAQNDSFKK